MLSVNGVGVSAAEVSKKKISLGPSTPSLLNGGSNNTIFTCYLPSTAAVLWTPVRSASDVTHRLSSVDAAVTAPAQLAEQLHSCLDALPAIAAGLLDLLWVCDSPPSAVDIQVGMCKRIFNYPVKILNFKV